METAEQARRLAAVKSELARRNLAAFLVPRTDEFQLEYAPPCSERLAWLTGFTGSAGLALVAKERAALFVDGRYTLQALRQTDASLWEHRHITEAPPDAWLEHLIGKGERVGYDPRLHTPDALRSVKKAVERAGGTMFPVENNPIDELWIDRPPPPRSAVELYPEEFAGESSAAKRARMAASIRDAGQDALVVSAADSVAWLFNIRGSDVDTTPYALGFAVLRADASAVLYIDSAKIGAEVRAEFAAQGPGVAGLAELDAFGAALLALGGKRVRVDQATGTEWILQRLAAAGATVDIDADPCTLAKACKTFAEVTAIRAAHLRDGVAMVRFLAWLDRVAPGSETEWTVAQKINALRAEGERYRGLSFHTISAVGPHAAEPHYSVAEASALPLEGGQILLVDSGAQYTDGTTDITRTMIIGTPTEEMKVRNTQVLKGHIALAEARFPAGTTGTQLDVLARQFLWSAGVDFDHGTGHGVGCFLSVHEGPHGISKRPNRVGLCPGMIVSDEPGYYKTGAFGIRIENLVVVEELSPQPEGAERTTFGFETLTVVPYDQRLIAPSMLTEGERRFIDAYHARVRTLLSPLVETEVRAFLERATAPLPR
ncbi:MAG TPA: aminopeptidase P family protein [Polyangiaceae bacterium]|nr:aminopeptidase P family protein [Polyangiaceae bacterium]